MASVAPNVVPIGGPNSTTGPVPGVPVTALGAGINGGWITNPSGASTNLYVDPTGSPPNLTEGGTTLAIYPGTTYKAIPGQTTITQVASPDSNHVFTSVQW